MAGETPQLEIGPPRELSRLINDIFRLWWKNVRQLAWVAAVIQVPLSLFIALLPLALGTTYMISPPAQPSPAELERQLGGIWIFLAISSVLSVLLTPIMGGALTSAVRALKPNQPLDVAAAYRAALARAPRLIGAHLILLLLVLGLALLVLVPTLLVIFVVATLTGPSALSGPSGVAVLVMVLAGLVGLVGLVIAMAFVFVRLTLVTQAVMFEDQPAVGALRRSWDLLRGRFWRTLAVLAVASVTNGVIGSIVVYPLTLLARGGGVEVGVAVQGILTAVLAAFLTPLGMVAAIEIFRDSLARSQAADAVAR